MNRFAYTLLLSLVLWLGMPGSSALAVRYTQVFPNGNTYAPVGSSVPPPLQQAPAFYGYYGVPSAFPQVAAGSGATQVYQGRIQQTGFNVKPLHADVYAHQPLQSPQVILENLKSKNDVPAEVAATLSVENSNVLNSYTDGQKIVITSNLLNKLTTSDERAFVISHELSHVLLDHVGKTQLRRTGLSLFDALVVRRYVSQGSPMDLATRFGLGLVDLRSSRGYEMQADDLGVRLMSQAGYDPEAAIQVFDILKANTPANKTPGFLLDHPITDERIRVLVQKYKLKLQ
jgi:Zn-dependent protease with chaperone function